MPLDVKEDRTTRDQDRFQGWGTKWQSEPFVQGNLL